MKEDLLLKKLLCDSHRATADMAVAVLIERSDLLQPMFRMACSGSYPWDMRASNVIEKADDQVPGFAASLIPEILEKMMAFKNDGPKRQFMRMLIRYTQVMDEDLTGTLFDTALALSADQAQSTGIRHNAILVLHRLAKRYPDISGEIFTMLKLRLSEEPEPFASWLRDFMKKNMP